MSKNEIVDLWLDPDVPATSQAIKALEKADFIIFCPGSLYGSVISNFLPIGIREALTASKATKVLITNLVSNRNQTHHFTPDKYLKIFRKFTGLEKPFDTVIVPSLTPKAFQKRYPKVARSYALEHAHLLSWSKKELKSIQDKDIKVLASDIISVTPQLNRLRHDPKKLSRVFKKLLG